MKEKGILRSLAIGGIIVTFFTFRKPPYKDLIIVYLLKAAISGLLDQIVVNKGFLKYPARFFPRALKTSILFDYLLFPWTCVIYYKLTKETKFMDWLKKALLFAIPLSSLEFVFLKKTKLLKFKKWNIFITLVSEMTVCIFIRSLMELLRKLERNNEQKNFS